MGEKKEKYPRSTSPKGRADYPWLQTPDTKFNKAGVYRTRLVLPLAEAQPLMDAIDAMAEEIYKDELKKRLPAAQKKKALSKEVPYTVVCDDAGTETGEVSFSFKLNARVEFTDKESGEKKTLTFKPQFFDAAGTALAKAPAVYAGSILRINYEPTRYMVAGTSSCGVTLRIHGIQVIKLVSGGGNESASDMGFGKEEGGYVADNFENNAQDTMSGEGGEPASGADTGDAGDF